MDAFDSRRLSRAHRWRGAGSVEPTFETFAGLTRAHITSIPFENVDVLLGRGVRIDLDSIVEKMVVIGRGGYCFEHGTLFQSSARTNWLPPHCARRAGRRARPRHQSPRTHMFLTVENRRQPLRRDPGFGGTRRLVPVPLREGVEVRDGGDRHRMVETRRASGCSRPRSTGR